jgi:threonine dehydratase
MSDLSPPPTLDDIKAAAVRIAPYAHKTPLIESKMLNERVGGRLLLKCENLQRTGSFKFRGAYNRISQLSAEQLSQGIVASSSGNHAQGVAAAAGLCGAKATMIMPHDAPAIKVNNTRALGADIVIYDRNHDKRDEVAARVVTELGGVFVHPYEHAHIVAGQGTSALEAAQELQKSGDVFDGFLVCCSGGGLTAGSAIVMSELMPDAEIYAVEPADFDDTGRSLVSGNRENNPATTGSICDALLVETPGEFTFSINSKLLKGALSVSDEEVRAAVRYAFLTLKLVVEPGGAVALAACLAGKIDCKDKIIGMTLSGGNIDPALFSEIISAQ